MFYYKVFHKNYNHFDFQYQEGLNIDNRPLDNKRDIYKDDNYGFHFSDTESISDFFYIGQYISEIVIPNTVEVYKVNSRYCKSKLASQVIIKNKMNLSEVTTWEWMYEQGINLNTESAVRWAVSRREFEILDFLISKIPTITENYMYLAKAYQYSCFDDMVIYFERNKCLN